MEVDRSEKLHGTRESVWLWQVEILNLHAASLLGLFGKYYSDINSAWRLIVTSSRIPPSAAVKVRH